jgi:hypothetical protein
MIEKREVALAKKNPPRKRGVTVRHEPDPRNVDDAMLLLGITVRDPEWTGPCDYGTRMKLSTWAVQTGLSRPGRSRLSEKQIAEIRRVTLEPEKLRWPRSMGRR